MTPELARAYARYNRWMNDKLFATSAELADADRKADRGAFFKSLHATLNHLLLADRVWMSRLRGERLPDGAFGPGGIRTLDQELYADFDELRRARVAMDTDILAWTEGLTPELLSSTLRYLRLGVAQEVPFWWAVAQMFNHQTHHRGQATTLLAQVGKDVGVTDLFAMLREEDAAR